MNVKTVVVNEELDKSVKFTSLNIQYISSNHLGNGTLSFTKP